MEFPDELDTSFFARVGVEPRGRGVCGAAGGPSSPSLLDLPSLAQEGLLPEEPSIYPDEVFETPSEAALKVPEAKMLQVQPALTGGALDRSELERSHLLL